jgi:hypothetical protein
MLIFTGLLWCIVLFEEEVRAPRFGKTGAIVFAVACGAIVGLGGLARYAFAWLFIPVLGFLIVFGGSRRIIFALLALVAFVGVLAPWLARNYSVCGTPFGSAGYAIVESTALFPEHRLERSLEPDMSRLYLMPFWIKLLVNSRGIIQSDLPKLGGSWVTTLFLAGLLVGFRKPGVKRLRYFLISCLVLLVIVQALGRTHLSEDSPEINSENLLVLLAPAVIVYGVSLFFLLLDQINVPFPQLRYLVMSVFTAIVCLPMLFVFLPPRTIPVAYPPYYPPAIQTVSGWLKENEMAMSDIPWAVAWYGQRQCVWLTLNAQKDFFDIHDYQKPIAALYLTPATMDSRFLSQWVRAGEQSWGSFILESIVKKEVPPSFPLRKAQSGWLPEQLVLTDWERWRKSSE